jgi:hypothetical protein
MSHENESEMASQGVIGLKIVEVVEGMVEVCGRPQG